MKKKGFTLIELLIVIALISILAVIAIPQYSKYKKRAVISKYITIAEQIIISEEQVNSDTGNYEPWSASNNSNKDIVAKIEHGNFTSNIEIPKHVSINVLTISCSNFNNNGLSIVINYNNSNNPVVTYNSCINSKPVSLK